MKELRGRMHAILELCFIFIFFNFWELEQCMVYWMLEQGHPQLGMVINGYNPIFQKEDHNMQESKTYLS